MKVWNGKLKGILSSMILVFTILFEKTANIISSFLFTKNIKYSGNNVQVMRGCTYRYPGSIEAYDNIIIGKKTSLTSEGLQTQSLIIETGVSIGSKCEIDFSGGVIIREKAHIAHSVLISTHDHGYDYRNSPTGKSLEIGKLAFIGSRSIIMHNCNYIGEHAVIGTGSVVTKNVPDYAVVAGNPARIIKYINNE